MPERYDLLCETIEALCAGKEAVLVAIDGPCAAGKTTLAAALEQKYGCNVFHMDDFFLRPAQRTPERFAEIGGNVDYERFEEEVLLPLADGKPFSYRPYDCKTGTLKAPVSAAPARLSIVEGVYSLHPRLAHAYDLTVFLSVSPEVQRQRLSQRDERLQQRFFEEWIPLENRYFDGTGLPQRCDLRL